MSAPQRVVSVSRDLLRDRSRPTRVRCAYPGYKRNIKMGSSFRWNDGDWVDGVMA